MPALALTNTLTRSKDALEAPESSDPIKLYTCGPTVYNVVHVGNLRAFVFYDLLKRALKWLGYEVKHTLLLHANSLNGDYFGELAAMMKRRGYTFITLEEALQDEAYRLGDPYTGPSGPSWLQRWAIGRGEAWRDEPPVDQFVRDITGF